MLRFNARKSFNLRDDKDKNMYFPISVVLIIIFHTLENTLLKNLFYISERHTAFPFPRNGKSLFG